MTSLTAIPLSDIKFFLTLNNISIPRDNIYSVAWDLIKSGTVTSAPPSVTDWIIAYNLLSQKINIPIYKTSEILLSQDKDLKDLANLLTLQNVDKESIIRILGYLKILNNDIDIFEALPQEILINILTKLDCKSILLICKSSNKFNKFCELKLNTLLKQKLHKETGFITDTYNREELVGLCRLHSTKHINAGFNHSLILKDGQVYSFGESSSGQLGLKNRQMVYEPTLISNLHNIKYISTGYYPTSWALNENGQVYSWGDQVLNSVDFDFTPQLIPNLNNIIQISAGEVYFYILNEKGQIEEGEIYDSLTVDYGPLVVGQNIPILAEAPNNVIQISAGSYHTLALTNTGEIYSFGNNFNGELGYGNYDDTNIPTLIPNLYNIIQISSGANHSLALSNDGKIYSFGINNNGQLGLGDNSSRNIPTLILKIPNNIIQISAGGDHSLALSNDGKIYSFGKNNKGQLGLGNYTDINIPTLISKMSNNIIQISAGAKHSLCLSSSGKIYSFGKNKSGQLGLGDDDDRNIPTLIPNFNVLS